MENGRSSEPAVADRSNVSVLSRAAGRSRRRQRSARPAAARVSVETLLAAVDRHIEFLMCGEFEAMLADCRGAGRRNLRQALGNLPTPLGSVVVEKVAGSGRAFAVDIRYCADASTVIMTTIWQADAKGRLSMVGASGQPGTASACA